MALIVAAKHPNCALACRLLAGRVSCSRTEFAAAYQHATLTRAILPNVKTKEGPRKAAITATTMRERMKTLKMHDQRPVFGGFPPIVETGSALDANADGCDLPVPAVNRDAYLRMALNLSSVFKNMARCAPSKAGAMTCPTARLPTFGERSKRKTTRRSSARRHLTQPDGRSFSKQEPRSASA